MSREITRFEIAPQIRKLNTTVAVYGLWSTSYSWYINLKIYSHMTPIHICNPGFSISRPMYSNIFLTILLQCLKSASMSQTINMLFLLKSDPLPSFTNTVNDTMIHLVVQDRNLEMSLDTWLTKSRWLYLPIITQIHLLISRSIDITLLQVSTIPYQDDCINLLNSLSIFIPAPSLVFSTL